MEAAILHFLFFILEIENEIGMCWMGKLYV